MGLHDEDDIDAFAPNTPVSAGARGPNFATRSSFRSSHLSIGTCTSRDEARVSGGMSTTTGSSLSAAMVLSMEKQKEDLLKRRSALTQRSGVVGGAGEHHLPSHPAPHSRVAGLSSQQTI